MVEHSNLPLMDSILHAYRELGFAGWVNAKLRGVALLLGIETDWRRFPEIALFSPAGNVVGASRVLDFYASARSSDGLLWHHIARLPSATALATPA